MDYLLQPRKPSVGVLPVTQGGRNTSGLPSSYPDVRYDPPSKLDMLWSAFQQNEMPKDSPLQGKSLGDAVFGSPGKPDPSKAWKESGDWKDSLTAAYGGYNPDGSPVNRIEQAATIFGMPIGGGVKGGVMAAKAPSGGVLAAAIRELDRERDLPKRAADLLKGRTDEEVAHILDASSVHNRLAGKEPKTSGPKSGDFWFPGANVKLDTSITDLDAGLNVMPRHNYDAPVNDISWDAQQGKWVIPFVGDRTATGTISHIGGDELEEYVKLYGGKDYMRGAEEGVWASEANALKPVGKFAAKYDNPMGVYMPMAGTGSDFAHMTENVVSSLWNPNQLTSEGTKMVDEILRTGKGVDGKYPDAPSVGSSEFGEMIATNSPLRKAYIQALDKKVIRDEGGVDMGKVRHAITDKDLLHVANPDASVFNEQLMGWGAADIDPSGTLNKGNHPTYNTDVGGDYLGRLPLTPRSVIMRDWERMRRGKGGLRSGDPRSIFTGPTQRPQFMDQEIIDAAKAYQYLLKWQQ